MGQLERREEEERETGRGEWEGLCGKKRGECRGKWMGDGGVGEGCV